MTTKKSKMGRPPLPKSLRRTVTLKIRVTPDERDELEAGAVTAAADISTWLRELGLKAAKRSTATTKES